MAPIYLGKRVVPSSLRYIENLALPLLLGQLHDEFVEGQVVEVDHFLDLQIDLKLKCRDFRLVQVCPDLAGDGHGFSALDVAARHPHQVIGAQGVYDLVQIIKIVVGTCEM